MALRHALLRCARLALPFACALALPLGSTSAQAGPAGDEARARATLERARANGRFAREAFRRARGALGAWTAAFDAGTGLPPRNLGKDRDLYVPWDSGADLLAPLVAAGALLDRAAFDGPLARALRSEAELTPRLGALPDTRSFSKQAFVSREPNPDALLFGGGELARHGFLELTDLLGSGPWTTRLDALTAELLERGRFQTAAGLLPLDSDELNGGLLQVLCRAWWRTGEERYLDAAQRIGDHYLRSGELPTRRSGRLRMRDATGELFAGLAELYATAAVARPAWRELVRPAVQEMFNRLLAVGRNEDGLVYDIFEPVAGNHVGGLADTFGTTLGAAYTVHLVDDVPAYRDAVVQALEALPLRYSEFDWEGDSANGLADALQGTLVLARFEPTETLSTWIEAQAARLWARQQPDGMVEGWHGDGAFVRTSLQLGLWRQRDLRLEPWREDLLLGVTSDPQDGSLLLVLRADAPWEGRLVLGRTPVAAVLAGVPDHPRAGSYPRWSPQLHAPVLTVTRVADGHRWIVSAEARDEGLALELEAGQELVLRIP